jgi:uncharacterized protein CbrC (UPF0167 family)
MTTFPVADGTIEKITCERESIFLEFLDWQKQRWLITFENVMGFSSVGAVGAETSEMFTENVTPLSTEVTKIDPSEVGTSYCFTSARGGDVILTIVANGYVAKKLT